VGEKKNKKKNKKKKKDSIRDSNPETRGAFTPHFIRQSPQPF
jgi:hypothetical protein